VPSRCWIGFFGISAAEVKGRYLIVNADDFGLSDGVNRGVVEAHEHGIVTSASLMVRPPSAGDAASYARSHPRLSVGLHLDLGEWRFRDSHWTSVYEVVASDDPDGVAAQVDEQLALFGRLVGRDPTHIDSHQHVHRHEPLRSILRERARALGVPLRQASRVVRYCGDFYGQTAMGDRLAGAVEVSTLARVISRVQTGITELACHPGLDQDVESMYRAEREQEVRTLCHPEIRSLVEAEEIRLISFADLHAVA
jgi:chitin disaccharide deacetylase